MKNTEFWRGRRVLVTGHAGFKGAWLCAWLLRMGAKVTGAGMAAGEEATLYRALGLSRRLHDHRWLDVRDLDALQALVSHAEPEVIFHLAAQALVLEGVRDPVGTFATNVMGTVNALEAARHAPATRALVVVTSDKCYRDPSLACGEDSPLGGADPYSASKACAELVAAAYRASYPKAGTALGIATARAGNVIGGGDLSPDRLVPDVVRAVLAGRRSCASRTRSAPGSTCWTRSRATCSSPSACTPSPKPLAGAGTSVPMPMARGGPPRWPAR